MRYIRAGWVVVVLASAASVHADTIKLTGDKKPLSNVTVLEETLKEIRYRMPKITKPQSVEVDKVADVVYSNLPEDYTVAEENLDVGAFGPAASLFKAAAAEAGSRKGFEVLCLYQAGEAFRRGGMGKEAVATYDELIEKYGDSRYLPMAVAGRAEVLVGMGDAAKARQGFEKLKTYGGRWDFESQLQLSIMDEAKNPAGALDTYKRLVSQTERDYPSVANQAKLRIGRSLIAGKKFDEAKSYFETILSSRAGSSAEIIAGAYNGLGAAMWNKPGATADDWKAALFAHLRVYVSYPEVSGEQPEALYSIGKCFQKVPGPESAARAGSFLKRCATQYPETEWGQKALRG